MSADLLSETRQAMLKGDRSGARDLLREHLRNFPKDHQAWILLAQVVERRDHAVYCLQQAKKLSPENQMVDEWLAVIATSDTIPEIRLPGVEIPAGTTGGETLLEENGDLDIEEDIQLIRRIDELFLELESEVQPLDPRAGVRPKAWHWACDEDGVYTECGKEVYAVLGLRPEEFLGENIQAYALAPKSQIAIDYFLKAGEYPAEVPVYFISSEGEHIPVKMQINAVLNERGVRVGWRGVAEELVFVEEEESEAEGETVPQEARDAAPERPRPDETTPGYCPYLGLVSDRSTHTEFPSDRNYCHRVGKAIAVGNGYQASYCLSPAYLRCSVYHKGLRAPYPDKIVAIPRSRSIARKHLLILIGLAILMLAALAGLFVLVLTTI